MKKIIIYTVIKNWLQNTSNKMLTWLPEIVFMFSKIHFFYHRRQPIKAIKNLYVIFGTFTMYFTDLNNINLLLQV
jgi:hypothetical protein